MVVPGPWWNTLTYIVEDALSLVPMEGVRVKVPLGKGTRVGFVKGAVYPATEGVKGLRPLEGVIDERPVLSDELWNLAGWVGSTFLCGMGTALQLMCPAQILRGEPLASPPNQSQDQSDVAFHEVPFYNPIDEERFEYYRDELSSWDSGQKRTLLLFPEANTASVFFAGLLKRLKILKMSKMPEPLKP